MRLICPNCGAQYAVADGVIPTGGRDVQCSNCAHTWFETPGASSNDQPPEPRKVATPTPPAADPNDLYSGSIDDAFKKADEEPDIAPAPQPPVDRKPVDRSVSDILREEAALETAQRRTEIGGNLESQSDLGLRDPAPEPPKQPIASQPNLAPAATATAATAATIAAASASRSELLPDIEEINSSLQSNSERDNAGALGEEAAVETKRRSFRRGFMTVLLIILILVLVYIYAEQIATMAPTLTDTLKSYVDAVDVGRIWLDDNVQAMLAYIAVEQP
jgi:predicted Zn finger-like uncharacterized protein